MSKQEVQHIETSCTILTFTVMEYHDVCELGVFVRCYYGSVCEPGEV